SSCFSVTIGNLNSIYDLKKAILEEISNPGNIKAIDLRLWSVNIDENLLESTSLYDLLNDTNELKRINTKGRPRKQYTSYR
ncbi:16269_t:CDS:1, partial [Funneliformis geosporum]